MIVNPRAAALLFWSATLLPAAAQAPSSSQPAAVIELFTSQGCSSCPPADKLLGELAKNPSILAMSEPIDYWDYLGWRDTLAQPRHTERQRSYAHGRGDREVYTPQVVVNGTKQVLGSDPQAIGSALARKAPDPIGFPVTVSLTQHEAGIEVRTTGDPATATGAPAEVWLCAISRNVPILIRRGENRGRTITYHNVVRRWLKLGDWRAGPQTWTVNRSDFAHDGVDAVAVLVQAGGGQKLGRILGAAMASLP